MQKKLKHQTKHIIFSSKTLNTPRYRQILSLYRFLYLKVCNALAMQNEYLRFNHVIEDNHQLLK